VSETTKTEIGVEIASGAVRWPDDDGDVYYGGDYYRVDRPDDLALLRGTLASEDRLVSRVVTFSEPVLYVDPLPTTPASVIRATRDGIEGVAMLTPDGDDLPWYFVPLGGNSRGRGFASDRHLTLLAILHEEGK
jgi:hypothetical protein